MLRERGLRELSAPAAAGERAAAEEAAAAAQAEAAVASAAERRRRRRAQRRTAAALLGSGKTQLAVAEALGVSERTIRNWKQAPSFQRDLERARERARRQARAAWERFAVGMEPFMEPSPREAPPLATKFGCYGSSSGAMILTRRRPTASRP